MASSLKKQISAKISQINLQIVKLQHDLVATAYMEGGKAAECAEEIKILQSQRKVLKSLLETE